jgi:indolepyruvate ferredoxin oxidoreductase alpha subunit
MVAACGVRNIRVVDPHDLPEMEKTFREEMARDELSVIITRRPCIMAYKPEKISVAKLDPEKCIGCKICMNLGCPAISWDVDKPDISSLLCWPNCNMCVQVCPVDAISKDMEGLE